MTASPWRAGVWVPLVALVAVSDGLQMSLWKNAGQGGTPTVSHVDGLGSLTWPKSLSE